MIRSFRDKVIVLRAYKLGEADRILVLLGEKTGQFRAVAKGVRRTSSKFGARLQSFNLVDVQVHRGRADLHTLTQAETLRAYSASLSEQYGAFTNAKLIVEAAQKITEGQELPSPEQFGLLHGALHALSSGARVPALVAASYLLRTASIEGWQPSLNACAVCGKEGWHHQISAENGGAICSECVTFEVLRAEPDVLRLMDALLRADWELAQSAPLDLRQDALELSGSWLQWQLEQRLKSLPFASVSEV